MVDSIKSNWKPKHIPHDEILFPLPARIWRRILEADKREKFLEAVSDHGSTFLFDLEGFCEAAGIQLSKEERRLWADIVKESPKYSRPRIVK